MANDLTIVILTQNEENNISEVIKNAFCVSDKVLIVDSGSNDRTVILARQNGAKVVYRAWDNDFSAQRNYSLKHILTKWVLYLDADERLDEKLCASIREAINSEGLNQYSIVRKIYAFGFEYKHGVFKPDEVVRLFPVKAVHWENKVHERAVCSLPKVKLDGYIEHYTYLSWQQWWDKAGRYTTIWAEGQFSKGKRTSLGECLSHAIYGFLRSYMLQLGFIDGWSGFYSSILHFMYTMLKYLKLYEIQNRE